MRMRIFLVAGLLLAHAAAVRAQTRQGVSCLGQIIAGERTITVSAPEGSVVSELLVRRGDRVDTNAELARLRDYAVCAAAADRALKEVELARAELALSQAGERRELVEAQQALIASREASVSMYERRLDRYEALRTNSFVTADQYEELARTLDVSRAELNREKSVLDALKTGRQEEINKAQAQVDVAESEHRLEMARVESQRIRAPISGEILSVQAYPGEAVGDFGILDMAETSRMMVLAEVYETDIPRVKLGDRARIRSAVFEGETGGQVVEIHREVEAGRIYELDPRAYTDRRIILVRILPDEPERLAAFNNAQVTVNLASP